MLHVHLFNESKWGCCEGLNGSHYSASHGAAQRSQNRPSVRLQKMWDQWKRLGKNESLPRFLFDLELYDSFGLDLFSTHLGRMFLSKHHRSFGKGNWHF